jgi:hypothetical protein
MESIGFASFSSKYSICDSLYIFLSVLYEIPEMIVIKIVIKEHSPAYQNMSYAQLLYSSSDLLHEVDSSQPQMGFSCKFKTN